MPTTPLRIGFASIYAWRPHVEFMMFLARLVGQAGHEAAFLTCDADLPACYTRELRDQRPDWMECLLCRAGGVRSYTASGVSAIGALAPPATAPTPRSREWAASSASTLGRFESPADYAGAEFTQLRDRLAPAVERAYQAAAAWIRRERLDAVCVFNGRIDATRGIFEAARDAGIRVLTYERSWFGDGIMLLPQENCLGLQAMHAMVGQWSSVPLSEAQARLAASYVETRLSGTNVKEWRAYNRDARAADWPATGRRRLLLLPGSLNEIWGDPGWESGWSEQLHAYDALIAHLGLQPQDLVLRCHPNWGERIGKNDGRRTENYYTQWARARDIRVIGSKERASTMALIAACDAVVLSSGTAALEAAALGKQVIATAPSMYQEAGFRTDATTPEALRGVQLDVDLPAPQQEAAQERLRRGALRFVYTMTHRFPQYVEHVKAVSTTIYHYPPGADPQRLMDLLRTGRLEPDDPLAAVDGSGEDRVIERMRAGDWAALQPVAARETPTPVRLRRRWFLRPIDIVREKMPVGDR